MLWDSEAGESLHGTWSVDNPWSEQPWSRDTGKSEEASFRTKVMGSHLKPVS